ncbi:MAG: hypothetical protein QXV82_09305 [Ignisphaera sp.]
MNYGMQQNQSYNSSKEGKPISKINGRKLKRKWYFTKKKSNANIKQNKSVYPGGRTMNAKAELKKISYISNDNFLSFYRILGEEKADEYFEKKEAEGSMVVVLFPHNREMDWRSAKAYYGSVIPIIKNNGRGGGK